MGDIFYVGVDGGATGTRARVEVLRDTATVARADAAAGPSSLTLSVEAAWRNVREAVDQALDAVARELGHRPAHAALRGVAALAGAGNARNVAAFRELASEMPGLAVTGDGFASLVGAHGGEPGCVVALGTGSVGYVLGRDGSSRQVGGWGFPAGDEGGGAWIGRAAVAATLRARDAGPWASELCAALWRRFGGARSAVLEWLQGATATRYAELAPLVIEHAEAGDEVAAGILAQAGVEAGRLADLLDPRGELPLAVIGGLGPILLRYLPEPVRCRVRPSRGSALDGAMLAARGAVTLPLPD